MTTYVLYREAACQLLRVSIVVAEISPLAITPSAVAAFCAFNSRPKNNHTQNSPLLHAFTFHTNPTPSSSSPPSSPSHPPLSPPPPPPSPTHPTLPTNTSPPPPRPPP